MSNSTKQPPETHSSCSCCASDAPSGSSDRERRRKPLPIEVQPVSKKDACGASGHDDCCSAPKTSSTHENGDACCSPSPEAVPIEEKTGSRAPDVAMLAYRVDGMDCPSCASTLQKGVNRLEGVEQTDVYYSTGKMNVTTDGAVRAETIEQTVQQLGYTPRTNQAGPAETYHIHGMDCGACASTISKHLANVDGVRDVDVRFSTGKMTIAHDLEPQTIVSEVQRVGYEAEYPNTPVDKVSPKEKRRMPWTTLAGILLLLGVGSSLAPLPTAIAIMFYLATIMVGGYKPAKSAYYAIKNRSLDMNVLMIGAAVGAPLIGEFFEGALVVWLFALGNALQNKSVAKTRTSISNLMDLAPAKAWVQQHGSWIQQHVEDVAVGQTILIKPGEKIPLDGTIQQGTSMIDQSPITGESLPVDKSIEDPVYAGTLNDFGTLEVKVTARPEDTTLSRIIHLVEEAQEQKAPTEAFIDRFATIYTPIVFAAAIGTMVVPPLLGIGAWTEWVYRGLALLVVACPCALVISTPVAIVSAIGNAAKQGVLIKGGAFLEATGKLDTLAFDKTGTLTEGRPVVEHVHAEYGDNERLLAIAHTMEVYSNHPIARAIVTFAEQEGINTVAGNGFSTVPGKGVQGTIDGETYFAGKPEWLEEMEVPLSSLREDIQRQQQEGMTITVIGSRDRLVGYIGVADTIRPVSSSSVTSLHRNGIRELTMLTGDNEGTATKIAQQANIDRYVANLLPENKAEAIRTLQQQGYRVGMVGDGINDAPALATADIGIAMGGAGTDTSMEAADIVLMADNLEKLPYTIRLSRKALAIIKQNIWFAILIKVAAIGLIVPDILTLWMAVLSDTGAALLVILNSLRLFRLG